MTKRLNENELAALVTIYDGALQAFEPIPKQAEETLKAYNETEGGFGLEVHDLSDGEPEPFEEIHYVNMGDLYSETMVYRRSPSGNEGTLEITTLADAIAEQESDIEAVGFLVEGLLRDSRSRLYETNLKESPAREALRDEAEWIDLSDYEGMDIDDLKDRFSRIGAHAEFAGEAGYSDAGYSEARNERLCESEIKSRMRRALTEGVLAEGGAESYAAGDSPAARDLALAREEEEFDDMRRFTAKVKQDILDAEVTQGVSYEGACALVLDDRASARQAKTGESISDAEDWVFASLLPDFSEEFRECALKGQEELEDDLHGAHYPYDELDRDEFVDEIEGASHFPRERGLPY